jgi:hypothetical protein
MRASSVGIIVGKPKVVAPLGEADVIVAVHEAEVESFSLLPTGIVMTPKCRRSIVVPFNIEKVVEPTRS